MNPSAIKKIQSRPTVVVGDIEKLQAMRETQKALKDRLALMDEAVKSAEREIIGAIVAGADVSQIPYSVEVQEVERRFPAWKEHFIERLGKAEADIVLAETAPTIHRKLVIK